MSVLHRGLTPRCKGPPQIILHLSLSVLTPPTPRPALCLPLSLALFHTHFPRSFASPHTLIISSVSLTLSLFFLRLCRSLTSKRTNTADPPTPPPPHTFPKHTHTQPGPSCKRGGPNGRKSRLMCRTNEEGKKEEKGRKKDGELFTTTGIK